MESGIPKKNVYILLFLAVSVLCSPSVFADPVPIVPPNSVANNSATVPALRPPVGNSVHVPRPDPVNNGNQCGMGNANPNPGVGNNGNHGLGNNGNHNGIGNANHGSGSNGNHNGFDKGNGNGNHGLGSNGKHDGFEKGNGNHGQGNNGSHNGNDKGNENHGWGGKSDSDRQHQYREFNRKHNVDLASVVGKHHNANVSCGGAGTTPKQPGHENNHGIEKTPQTNIVSNDHSNVMTAGLGSLVAPDAKDKTVLPVQTSEVSLPTGTSNTIDVNGDGLIHLETSTPQPKSEVSSEVSHGHASMTVQEVKQVVNDLVSLGSVAEAEVMSLAKNGEVILHPAETSPSSPTVQPSVTTMVDNPAPQSEISVVPSAPSVEKISESISPNILDSSSSQTVINNPRDASLKKSDIEAASDYSNSGKPSQLENTNQSLIVVGQVVKVSGNAIEIDQNGTSHALRVGNNVHLGSKFKFEGDAGNLVIRSFTGELINVEV